MLAFAPMIAAAPAETALTIYNGGFALVREVRSLDLQQGRQPARIEDVAQTIEADSVSIRSLDRPGSFTVLEQNYQYDLISPSAILNKAVGQRISFRRVHPDGRVESLSGELLSAPTAIISQGGGSSVEAYNGMVIRADDGRIILNPTGEIEVSSIPEGLISKPSLLWLLESRTAGAQRIELSYLAQQINWTSNYVLNLDSEGNKGALKGWVTITNNTGASFKDARLKLLAGDVRRARQAPMGVGGGAMRMMEMAADAGFQEESFADYHLYTLQRPATVSNREIKQISLLEAPEAKVQKRLILDFAFRMGGPVEGEIGSGPVKPTIVYELENSEANGLGMPLPQGTFKIFQQDSTGSPQMLGEDSIGHTPRNETVKLKVGQAFDVVGEWKRTSFEWLARALLSSTRETIEIEVRNRKETPETVDIIERLGGEWKVTQFNDEFEKLDASAIRFRITLKPNEVRTIRYTVETAW
jgi:hypothetical protein